MADLVHSRILLNVGKVKHIYIYIFTYSLAVVCLVLTVDLLFYLSDLSHMAKVGYIPSIYVVVLAYKVVFVRTFVWVFQMSQYRNIVKSLLRLGGCKNDEGKKCSIIYRKSGFVIWVRQPRECTLTKIFLRIL